MHLVFGGISLVVAPVRIVIGHDEANYLFLVIQRRRSCVDWFIAVFDGVVGFAESLHRKPVVYVLRFYLEYLFTCEHCAFWISWKFAAVRKRHEIHQRPFVRCISWHYPRLVDVKYSSNISGSHNAAGQNGITRICHVVGLFHGELLMGDEMPKDQCLSVAPGL